MLPDVRSYFSKSVIEVEENSFVLLAFMALICQIPFSEDENIMDANALSDKLLKLSKLRFCELFGINLTEYVLDFEEDEVGPIGSIGRIGCK